MLKNIKNIVDRKKQLYKIEGFSALFSIFRLALAINFVLLCMLVVMGIFIYRSSMSQVNDLGAITLQSFRAARPMFWSMRDHQSPRQLEDFVNELAKQKAIKNFIVYTEDGVIFSYDEDFPKEILLMELPNSTVLHENNLIIYDKYRFVMHNRVMSELHLCLVIDALPMKRAMTIRNISIMIALLIQIMLIFFYYRLRLLAVAYDSTQKKLIIAQQEAITGRFASILAHEIKNPLSSIKGLVGYTMKKIDDESLVKNLERSISEVDRLTEIVNGFLSFGKPIELNKKEISIQSLLQKSVTLLKYDLESSGKTINISEGDFVINADYNSLMQVFVNLLLNAIEATPADKAIEVEILQGRALKIKNYYSGDCANISAILDPFVTTKARGSGLGLAISKKIIDMHQFDISIECDNQFIVELNFNTKDKY